MQQILRLLGVPHYEGARRPAAGLPEKAFILVSVLVFERGHQVARERMRTILWEEASAQRAADSLRWLISKIRLWQREAGIEIVEIGRDTLRLATDATIDAALLLEKREAETADELDQLAELYRGELLAGVDGNAGPLLSEHIARWRNQVHGHYVRLARDAAVLIPGERSERILRDLVSQDGADEDLARALLFRVATDKGPVAARIVYDSIVRRLRDEFDAVPSIETRTLFAQLVPSVATTAAVASQETTDDESGVPRIVLMPPETPLPVDRRAALLADAMIEDVCLQLCRMRTFAMFAPHTARQVAGLEPVVAVAPYGVRYLAKTMLVPKSGGGLRLSLSLVQTTSGSILFADQFDFDEDVISARFAELAETIAGQVAKTVERVEIGSYRRTGAASAYVQYLLGTKVLDPHDLKRLRRARHHFARALELEPNYVPAMTGIARTLSKEALALRRADGTLPRRAMELADQAARIDPLDPNAWREKAAASLYLHDLDASLEFLDAALSRARHHADIIAEKAEVLVHASRPREAREHMLEAMSLNPLPPDDYHWTLGSAEFFLGRYEQSVSALRRMRNTDSASRLISAAAAMTGDMATAARYRERWMQIYPDSRIESFAGFMPHASKGDIERYVDALRRAGFA